MKLNRVQIKNFRLLRDVELFLESETSVIVGRNNSGKTSLSEVIRRFTSDKNATFYLQDFSTECYEEFCAAFKAEREGKEESEIRTLLPIIELRLFFRYNPAQPRLGPLGEFIVDLDMACDEALVVMRFEPMDGAINRLFDGLPEEITDATRKLFFREIAARIHNLYGIKVWAEDPNDASNRKESSQAAVRTLLKTGFINAQRGLDDITTKESDVLAKVLEGLFNNASLDTADEKERKIAEQLEEAVRTIQETIDSDFRSQLQQLLPTLQTFGYPGLGGSVLTTETSLDVHRLLTNHTKIRYEGDSGVLLPESYNGLGMRNLIFILLQIVSFYREFRAQAHAPGVHIVFIEEPEAHLHPQMQEVFIRQIGAIVEKLNKEHEKDPEWPVQFLVSTHSSHIANEAHFESIRYFLPSPANDRSTIWNTKIKDLRRGMSSTKPEDKKFLHQYLTLTRCDLFFADKAILIEGTSERLMLPIMIKKRDKADTSGPKLRSQYLTIMEVGGAYAHKFFDLLNFLELQTLIVTDLDPVTDVGGKKCLVHEANATSNACINSWFGGGPNVPNDLLEKSDEEQIRGRIRIAYQCREVNDGPCGRTFEDAFLLANDAKFGVSGDTPEALAGDALAKAETFKKSAFALQYAIDDTDWNIPKYINDGLAWLARGFVAPPTVPVPPEATVVSEDIAEESAND
ncbi:MULTISPECIES: ATP-dependent nuclease [Halomonadaceae]|uniref:ATP-dependent nuclease n=1 Tax=Halomonadaceae TaxID=28256 RepID=UPI0012EF92EB|nr:MULTISPECIES: ATP-dependent endonuclease [Halomonas]CAD5247219.1 ATP-dependent OLD family endonuclease [Halomonas sp. 156]CAD5266196.1 ATP-dependent OLD family endonuclease [Halomonas sp. 113]CAD5268244.1 ATP-dependent OLD family endonuclease [Halomonas sp. 59]CAD5281486.1 ATP-dependent OLD family endonuclease [Halomonas sp. I3]VXA94021.1 ATP-dependent OLD family endonuclease [Halomonas titanicae]